MEEHDLAESKTAWRMNAIGTTTSRTLRLPSKWKEHAEDAGTVREKRAAFEDFVDLPY